MTRHGWYEWRPDTRDERRDLEDVRLYMPESFRDLEAALWCETCGRYRPDAGCPACGEPNA